MKIKTRPAGFALISAAIIATACQTSPPCPAATIATEDLELATSVAEQFAPILVSRQDVLTCGTAQQVADHNNVYWCKYPGRAPDTFDRKVCEAGEVVCRDEPINLRGALED